MQQTHTAEAIRVSNISILANVLLSAVKLAAGLLARSGAMVSDAVHSLSDVFSTVVVIIGVRLAEKPEDREHPYGHERLESVAAIVLSVVLLITGVFIGYSGIRKMTGDTTALETPGALALAAAIVSIVVKEAMFQYTRAAARRIDSEALMADAWHHRSDALSSVGALFGIAGARLGYPILDPLASVVICAFIGKAAFDIFREAIDKMMDRSCDETFENEIRDCAMRHDKVLHIDLLRTREFGSRVYIEMEIAVDGNLPLYEAHAVAESVHNDIEASFPKVKHIMIHVNPA